MKALIHWLRRLFKRNVGDDPHDFRQHGWNPFMCPYQYQSKMGKQESIQAIVFYYFLGC